MSVMDLPKVSIITICKDSEKYIRQTIESVLNQTYPNIEYIIIDGQSKDDTLKIIDEFVPLFEGRLICLSEKDEGIYDAMNKGVKRATGEIVGIINSDDWYEKDAVESVVDAYLSDKKVAWFHGNLNWIDVEREQITLSKPLKELGQYSFYYWMPVFHPTVFIKKEAYEKVGLFDTQYRSAADYDLILRLMKSDLPSKYIDKVIANFREGGFSKNYRRTFKESTLIKISHGCNPAYAWWRYYEVTTKISVLNKIKKYNLLMALYKYYQKLRKNNSEHLRND